MRPERAGSGRRTVSRGSRRTVSRGSRRSRRSRRAALHVRTLGLGAVASLGLAGIAAGVAGASTGNGVSSKSPNAILSAAASATKGASSFTLNGTVVEKGSSTTFRNLTLSNSGDAQGTVTEDGDSLDIIKVNNVLYIKGNAAFWTKADNASAGRLLGGKWVYGSPQTFASLSNELSTSSFVGSIKTNVDLAGAKKGRTTTIAGQPVISISGTNGKTAGIAYVATTGKPYIVRVSLLKGSSGVGAITFTNYNKPVHATKPPGAVNVNDIGKGSSG
jgi:hypothetical protein